MEFKGSDSFNAYKKRQKKSKNTITHLWRRRGSSFASLFTVFPSLWSKDLNPSLYLLVRCSFISTKRCKAKNNLKPRYISYFSWEAEFLLASRFDPSLSAIWDSFSIPRKAREADWRYDATCHTGEMTWAWIASSKASFGMSLIR